MGDRSLFHSLDASRSERPICARSLPVDMACVGGTAGLPFLNHRDMSGGGAGGAAATPFPSAATDDEGGCGGNVVESDKASST